MDFENLHAALTVAPNGVGTLTIRNAGRLNILGTPVIEGLLAALEHVARTPSVRVLVMRGEGDQADGRSCLWHQMGIVSG